MVILVRLGEKNDEKQADKPLYLRCLTEYKIRGILGGYYSYMGTDMIKVTPYSLDKLALWGIVDSLIGRNRVR